ncbi:MAG: hypothetical protein KDD67_13310 [Ignavibacteriae bacterium]|nr:hypothetical protein [Ignavibacteriota bacterium]MCB9217077.1 hypothetical protein [Ignavibacteria bacterium]
MSRMYSGFVLLSLFLFSGCLTASRKIIKFDLNPDGSGKGSMIFLDIMSMQEDENDRSVQDYTALVNDWLNGTQFEEANPSLYDIQKRLAADKNRLNAEITFKFGNYADVGLYRHHDSGPWMYYAYLNTSKVEYFDTTNGEYAGGAMPVIFWPEKTTEFRIANSFNHEERPVHSLYSLYNDLGVTPNEGEK